MTLEEQQAFSFALAYLVAMILAVVGFLAISIWAVFESKACQCKYDWSDYLGGSDLPMCVKCNEPFKVK